MGDYLFIHSDLQFLNDSHFGIFFLFAAVIDSHTGFILQMLMYLFFTYIDKWNNATVTYFMKFMNIYSLLLI